MADVQSLFEKFHKSIRTYYEINETLREKKDIILKRVKAHLAKHDRPTCEVFLQGSYKMKVGICALEGAEYDIDVGLRFSFKDSDHTASEVRKWVFEAVDGHTERVEAKSSCIRVSYSDGFHVDLVCYAWWDDKFGQEQHRLAHKSKGWREADPPKLAKYAKDARTPFEGTEDSSTQTDQFRRVVRYLKRWNDNAILGESNGKPSGLALLLLTAHHLGLPTQTWDGSPDDLAALEQVARPAASTSGRISVTKPAPEGEDVFARISDQEMAELKNRFGLLRDVLVDARTTKEVSVACKRLREVFGDDFPCPDPEDEKKETALRTSAPAIVPSNMSA